MTRHAWEKYDREKSGWVFYKEKAREEFNDAEVDDRGVARWKSNGNVPPDDCLCDWDELGLQFDIEESRRERERQLDKFAAEYRRNRRKRGYSSEELFEMRAAFGEGETVVDVITGERIKL